MAKGFFDIKAWQKADDLAVEVYNCAKSELEPYAQYFMSMPKFSQTSEISFQLSPR